MLNIPAPSQFRKKPVVVSASQWFMNGDHPLDYSKTHDGLENGELRQFSPEERRANGWEGDIVRYYRHPDDSGERACQLCGNTMHMHGWIDTKEGGHIVCPGDWIITGVQGEHYPCKPYIFAETYEPASPLSAAPASVQEEAKDGRQAFEAWHKREFGSYVPGVTIHYNRWLGWEGRASVAAPAAGDALGGVIAGALFDLMGYLTTLDTPISLGSTEDAAVAVEILQRWAALRGLNLDNADVEGWAERRSAAIDAALAAQQGKGGEA